MSPPHLPAGPRRAALLRQTAFALLVVTSSVALLAFWRGGRDDAQAGAPVPATPVAAIRVSTTDVPAALEAVATLRAVQEVMLAPEVAGRVIDIRLSAGTKVAAGDLLLQLQDAPEQAEREAVLARAAFARLQVERSRQLAASGTERREQLQQREAALAEQQSEIRSLDARIAQKRVTAPFAGQVGIRRVDPGQYVQAGQALATLTNLDRLFVEFSLPQQEVARLTVGSAVAIVSDAWPGRRFQARLAALEPQVGRESRTITVQALLDNPDHALLPGMYVTAALALPPETGVMLLPATAIQTSAQGENVLVVRGAQDDAAGRVEMVGVSTGRRVGDQVIVTAGLSPGDLVVTEGQLRVQPGAAVVVSPLRAAEVR